MSYDNDPPDDDYRHRAYLRMVRDVEIERARRALGCLADTVFSNLASGKIRRKLSGWRSAAAELERFGAEPLNAEVSDLERIHWLERWRGELTRSMRHRGLHRYTFTIEQGIKPTYGPRRAYPKRAA